MGIPFFLKSWEDVGENIGSGTRSFVQDSGEKLLDGACNIVSKYPRTINLNPYTRGLIKGLCNDIGKPIPNEPPPLFQGGQCPVKYSLRIRVRVFPFKGNCNTPPDAINEYTTAVWGEINDIYLDNPIGDCGGFAALYIRCHGATRRSRTSELVEVRIVTATYGQFAEVVGVEITRQDELPDDCGNPPTQFPPDPDIDPSDFNYNTTINNYNNNGDVIETNEYSVEFTPKLTGNFDFDVNLGDTKLTINNNGFGSEEKDRKPTTRTTEGEEKEEEEVEQEGILWALVDVTTPPEKGKTIAHTSENNITYFAGYFSWLVEFNNQVYRLQDEPIRRKKTAFKAPVDAKGFTYYSVNKAALKVSVITVTEDDI